MSEIEGNEFLEFLRTRRFPASATVSQRIIMTRHGARTRSTNQKAKPLR